MALQINKAITTKSGFSVPSGSYVWLYMELGSDRKYMATCRLFFFKTKTDFDAGRSSFDPSVADIPDDKKAFFQEFTAQQFSTLTAMDIHQYVQAQLNATLGGNFVTIVP